MTMLSADSDSAFYLCLSNSSLTPPLAHSLTAYSFVFVCLAEINHDIYTLVRKCKCTWRLIIRLKARLHTNIGFTLQRVLVVFMRLDEI